MAGAFGKLKDILDDPSESSTPSSNPRDVAIHHATILQRQKDLEAKILENLILLSEFPTVRDSSHSAAKPAPGDCEAFVKLVRLFQPSDYDDLIEERNVNKLCGYTLCPLPRRGGGQGGKWMITSGDIVRRKEYEMWCSQECAKRALYVKVQLNETAAWERAGAPDIRIELYKGEEDDSEADKAARKLEAMKIQEQQQAAEDQAALALERGEGHAPPGSEKVKVDIREKDIDELGPGSTGAFTDDTDSHLVIDGHKTKLVQRPKRA